jgi:type IV secretory pathway VirB3-like protein
MCVTAMKKAGEQRDISYFLIRLKNKRQLYVLVASAVHLFTGDDHFESDRRMRTICMERNLKTGHMERNLTWKGAYSHQVGEKLQWYAHI